MIAHGPNDGARLRSGGVIRVRAEDTGGALAVVRQRLRPGAYIPPHTHANDVWIYVLSGQTSVMVGDDIAHGGPGSFLLKPRGVVHAMWNETGSASHIFEFLTPAGTERFFERVAALPADDTDAFVALCAEHGLRFLDAHPRDDELRARATGGAGMPPVVTVREVPTAEGDMLASLLQLYLYDIAEYAHGGWNPIGADGRYAYRWFDGYWTDPRRHPLLIEADGAPAGFALVNAHSLVADWEPAHAIGEFFVLRAYRGRGVGGAAAHQVFDRFPGRWQVAQDAPNIAAQAFWLATVDAYTGGAFECRTLDDATWNGPVLLFTSSAR